MKKYIFSFFMLACLQVFFFHNSFAQGSNEVFGDQESSVGDQRIYDKDEIAVFNRGLLKDSRLWCRDLNLADHIYSKEALKELMLEATQGYRPEEMPQLFLGDEELTPFYWESLFKEMNMDNLPREIKGKYALVALRGNIRLLPTDRGLYESLSQFGKKYDLLQGSAIDPLEPVLVLAYSRNQEYAFILGGDYMGWLEIDKLIFMDKAEWLTYINVEKKAVVTDNLFKMQADQDVLLWQMGSVLPLASLDYTKGIGEICIYVKNKPGIREKQIRQVKLGEGLSVGYLPFNQQQIIQQALKFLGDEYDWGGKEGSVDCSSLVQNIYNSMGLYLPRDADKQEMAMPKKIDVRNIGREEKLKLILQQRPGALLFMPGHVMLYMGTEKGCPRVLHALSSHYEQGEKIYVRRVILSDLDLQLRRGDLLSAITTIGNWD